jgi:hypothetical protein
MAPNKNTNRDRRSPIEQLEDPKRFKMTNRSQVDDNDEEDPGEDVDYDGNDDAQVVVNTQTSKSSAKRHVVESEDEEVIMKTIARLVRS